MKIAVGCDHRGFEAKRKLSQNRTAAITHQPVHGRGEPLVIANVRVSACDGRIVESTNRDIIIIRSLVIRPADENVQNGR